MHIKEDQSFKEEIDWHNSDEASLAQHNEPRVGNENIEIARVEESFFIR